MEVANRADIEMRVLPTQSSTQNVMFLFESMTHSLDVNTNYRQPLLNNFVFPFHLRADRNDSGKTILYTGDFTEYRSIQENNHFVQSANKGIDHLYIDNTLREMDYLQDDNSIPKTCAAIRDLMKYVNFSHRFNSAFYKCILFDLSADTTDTNCI